MPAALKSIVFAAALGWAAAPLWAAGMPDTGTKNFSPGAGTPAYFTNDGNAGDTEAADDGADVPTRSVAAAAAPSDERAVFLHHGGRSASHRSGIHSAAYTHANRYSSRIAMARSVRGTRIAEAGRGPHTDHAASRTRAAPTAAIGKSRLRHAAAPSTSRRG
jgi:hypothetical protein